MRVVFVGSSGFGLRCLEACGQFPNIELVGIVTAPQTFSISYQRDGMTNVLYADVQRFGETHQIPVKILEHRMNDSKLIGEVSKWNPDMFLVVGWYHMIPRKWRDLAPAYGLHASLLPDYSGGAPLVWAIINGETKTGITLFQMDDGVDSGLIAGQKEESIRVTDTIATLYSRIEERGLELLLEKLPQLIQGTIKLRHQDESKRNIMPQRSPEDGLIDWRRDSVSIDRFVRAQTRPYPGAFSTLDSKPLHIWQACVDTSSNDELDPGRVRLVEKGSYTVACTSGTIVLHEISYGGKTYLQTQLAKLLGRGGQKLGASTSF
jgi:methionyl-tRNA formyltransferase